MKIRRVLLIIKRSGLSQLKTAKGPEASRMRRLLREQDRAVERLLPAHQEHIASIAQVKTELRSRGIEYASKQGVPTKPISGFDLVIPVGGDGLLLAASHCVRNNTPVLGVNSAPSFSVGSLCTCRADTFGQTLELLGQKKIGPVEVQRLRVRLGKKVLPEPVLNDVLFCADDPAVTARYFLIWPDGDELQRSSGVWISTPAGSTAAMASAGGPSLPLASRRFAFCVREPYAPPGRGIRLRSAVLDESERVTIQSRMFGASIFIDGSHRRYAVPFGEKVSFSLHNRPLRLIKAN